MAETKADLIFHPVRMRVVQALLHRGRATPGELAALLDDVPPATLYRHVARLAEGGVIEVVSERAVRGATERVYALSRAGGASLGGEELRDATPEDHTRYFSVFLAGLLGDFERYVRRPGADPAADGVGYRQFPLHLSDEELEEFLAAMNELIERAMRNEPRPGRRPRVLTRILVPSPPTETSEDEGETE